MTWATVPICDQCWREEEGERQPVRMTGEHQELERCYRCHAPTLSGIYVRRMINPQTSERT